MLWGCIRLRYKLKYHTCKCGDLRFCMYMVQRNIICASIPLHYQSSAPIQFRFLVLANFSASHATAPICFLLHILLLRFPLPPPLHPRHVTVRSGAWRQALLSRESTSAPLGDRKLVLEWERSYHTGSRCHFSRVGYWDECLAFVVYTLTRAIISSSSIN